MTDRPSFLNWFEYQYRAILEDETRAAHPSILWKMSAQLLWEGGFQAAHCAQWSAEDLIHHLRDLNALLQAGNLYYQEAPLLFDYLKLLPSVPYLPVQGVDGTTRIYFGALDPAALARSVHADLLNPFECLLDAASFIVETIRQLALHPHYVGLEFPKLQAPLRFASGPATKERQHVFEQLSSWKERAQLELALLALPAWPASVNETLSDTAL